MEFTVEELDILRSWYNAVEDSNPLYLEEEDRMLHNRIVNELSQLLIK